ncbi:B3/4 domain-containing protein [Mechercharimyces sp. CAU 1602]|uniref:B3/B4 domain-containing protein n=1 Tax=Mechercharimyces sp. CAU 1602 TaxID=2973933 RepID=UPI002163C917|nr:phenylalanine--tRNA ligase beta subunit-related protein [Mechercharimyces sp. CAU 1602]MCS1351716.1 phenylalanine--tRNA ligase beta subunit-related protein [Mechercharimyces sp. CAU 1602]
MNRKLISLTLDNKLKERVPDLQLALLHYVGCEINDSSHMFQDRTQLFTEHLRLEYETTTITELPPIQLFRHAFKQVGSSPSRYRPSAEALLRRILKGDPFYFVNSAVDANNFFSLRYLLPFGIYNASALTSPITCTIGNTEDHYLGLNGREISLANKIVLQDVNRPFGSPYVDSQISQVTKETTNCLQVIFSFKGATASSLHSIAHEVSTLFTQVNGGEVRQTTIVE